MSILQLIASVIYVTLIYGLLLFVPAGTLHWWRGWVMLVVTVVNAIAGLALLRNSPDLLKERSKPPFQKGQPLADKFLTILLIGSYFYQIIFIPLDVFRYHYLLGKPGPIVSVLGLILYVAGWWIMILALRENAFASAVVRVQEERHQKVIDTGVYGIVRHPMYFGASPLMIGMPLWLESYAATLLALVPLLMMIIRIPIEEKLLMRDLPGYDEYTRKVRYHLIPHIW